MTSPKHSAGVSLYRLCYRCGVIDADSNECTHSSLSKPMLLKEDHDAAIAELRAELSAERERREKAEALLREFADVDGWSKAAVDRYFDAAMQKGRT